MNNCEHELRQIMIDELNFSFILKKPSKMVIFLGKSQSEKSKLKCQSEK